MQAYNQAGDHGDLAVTAPLMHTWAIQQNTRDRPAHIPKKGNAVLARGHAQLCQVTTCVAARGVAGAGGDSAGSSGYVCTGRAHQSRDLESLSLPCRGRPSCLGDRPRSCHVVVAPAGHSRVQTHCRCGLLHSRSGAPDRRSLDPHTLDRHSCKHPELAAEQWRKSL